MTMQSSNQTASDGFWGSVTSGLGEGIGKVVSEVLPVWVNSQVNKSQPAAQVSNPINTSMGRIPVSTIQRPPMPQSNFLDAQNVTIPEIKPNTVLAGGVVIVGLIILFKVL